MTRQKIEQLKSEGKHREAGALAFNAKQPRAYGCHYGFSGLDRAIAIDDFNAGYDEAAAEALEGIDARINDANVVLALLGK